MSSPTASLNAENDSHAPALAHTDVTGIASPAATRYAESFIAALRLQLPHTSHYEDRTTAPWDTFIEVIKGIDELRDSDGFKSLRCSYFAGSIYTEYMPIVPHELGHRNLMHTITGTICWDMAKKDQQEALGYFVQMGASRWQKTDEQLSIEGDSSLASEDNMMKGPTLVIECGASQSYSSLHSKCMAWFGLEHVKVVILVNLKLESKDVQAEVFQRVKTPSASTPSPEDQEATDYRSQEAAAGVEIFMDFEFSSRNVDQLSTPIRIPYSGLFWDIIPEWAPPGDFWEVPASLVLKWAKGLIKSME